MRRRETLTALLSMALAPGVLADGRVRTVGYLSNGAGTEGLSRLLAERGHVEGRNLKFELRVAPADRGKLDEVAAELVGARVDALVAFGALNVGVLARRTQSIPIVCMGTADPVGSGFAQSLRRPGKNITGLSLGLAESAEIQIGLLRTLRPGLRRVAAVVEDTGRGDAVEGWGRVLRSLEDCAKRQGVAWEILPVAALAELERSLGQLGNSRAAAVYFVRLPEAVPFLLAASIANRRRLVSFSTDADMVREGALMHYSLDHADPPRRVAAILDQVLRGADPGGIPFELPDRTTFLVNRATAKAIGLELPAEILARATEIVG